MVQKKCQKRACKNNHQCHCINATCHTSVDMKFCSNQKDQLIQHCLPCGSSHCHLQIKDWSTTTLDSVGHLSMSKSIEPNFCELVVVAAFLQFPLKQLTEEQGHQEQDDLVAFDVQTELRVMPTTTDNKMSDE